MWKRGEDFRVVEEQRDLSVLVHRLRLIRAPKVGRQYVEGLNIGGEHSEVFQYERRELAAEEPF